MRITPTPCDGVRERSLPLSVAATRCLGLGCLVRLLGTEGLLRCPIPVERSGRVRWGLCLRLRGLSSSLLLFALPEG